MGKEIERKFLVLDSFKNYVQKSERITQGYLNSDIERTVRVRIKGDKGFITVKGKNENGGLTRFEWEKEIPLTDAQELLKLCELYVIDKTRYYVNVGSHVFEIDEFYGDNNGLIVAEVELNSENENFEKPAWLGAEVTGDAKYYNSALSKNPYKNWLSR